MVDLSDRGTQPMTRDHLTIVYNGELYNFSELRSQLSSHFSFETGTDTEVVLRAWQHWGPSALVKFIGMFAFAIWDAANQKLFLVRDRLGIKPLYLRRSADALIFASEVGAVLEYGEVVGRPDMDALRHQVLCGSTLEVERGRTLVAGVESLLPATIMTVDTVGSARSRLYWELPEAPSHEPPGSDRASDLRELLADSVSRMVVSDAPVGTFLSGGLDSSGITALAARHRRITAITATYANGTGDDLRYSKMLAMHYRGQIDHKVVVQPTTVTLDDIDAVCDLASLGDDVRHVNILRNYRSVRELSLRGVLNGQGADETMAGYVGRENFVRTVLDVRDPRSDTIAALPGAREPHCASPDLLSWRAEAHAKVLDFEAGLPGAALERVHRLMIHTQLERILRFEDYLSMRESVEARVPFLDHRIVEWCFGRPFATHVRPVTREGKMRLRSALGPMLPAPVLTRPKQVFPFPDLGTLHRRLSELVLQYWGELEDDPVLAELFKLPPRDRTAELPTDMLWLLLSIWRWHRKLIATAMASCRGD